MAPGMRLDEMGAPGPVRPAYARLAQWLDGTPPELLASRRRQAELLFRRIGITFAVYGDKEATERLIPFDIVPRILHIIHTHPIPPLRSPASATAPPLCL